MQLSNSALEFVAKLIEKEIGIVYSDGNFYQLEKRLDIAASQLGYPDAEQFCLQVMRQGLQASERTLLMDLATNNETLFFRDASAFAAIENILQTWCQAATSAPMRIWSAACSTGQEVYSLAMLITGLTQSTQATYSILASDVSPRVLEQAELGLYTQQEVQRGLAASQIAQYFNQTVKSGQQVWEVKPILRRGLTFQPINLLGTWPRFGLCDLILCRNVLIYQTVESKKRVVTKLYEQLAPGGYLILGGAESLFGITDAFTYVDIGKAVVYRKPTSELLPRSA